MKDKKGGMSVSIVFLALFTLIISSTALFTFYTRENSIKETIYTAGFLEDVYSKEELMNFYISSIIDNAVKDIGKSETIFVSNFKSELAKYKDKDGNFIVPELKQIEEQINEKGEEIADIADNKLEIEFEITIEDKIIDREGKELFLASHTYKKKFEKNLV